jgi:hypothetical protein
MEAFMRNGAESKLVGTWEYLSTNSKWPSWGGQCVLGGGGGAAEEDPKRVGTWQSF